MTDKDLKKLTRRELLEMLIAQSKKLDRYQAKLEEMNQKIAEKEILIQDAGSIAEAAIRINNVFDAAQEAADQYTLNAKRLADKKLAEANADAESIVSNARLMADLIIEKKILMIEKANKKLKDINVEIPELADILSELTKSDEKKED